MEKVRFVLLKKSGIIEETATPQAADLQKYQMCYKKPLTTAFVEAVTSLVECGAGSKIKQETKIEDMTRSLVIEMLGPRFGDNFVALPAVGTRGGVLVACTADYQITEENLLFDCCYSITATILHRSDLTTWSMTAVYGPQEDGLNQVFVQEIRQIKGLV